MLINGDQIFLYEQRTSSVQCCSIGWKRLGQKRKRRFSLVSIVFYILLAILPFCVFTYAWSYYLYFFHLQFCPHPTPTPQKNFALGVAAPGRTQHYITGLVNRMLVPDSQETSYFNLIKTILSCHPLMVFHNLSNILS